MDADERIITKEAYALRESLLSAPPTVGAVRVVRIHLLPTGGFFSSESLRAFRYNAEIRYEGAIAESVAPSVARAGLEVRTVPVLVTHLGFCRPRRERDAKLARYIVAMEPEVDRPGREILASYIGANQRLLGRFDEAEEWTRRGILAAGGNHLSWFLRGQVLRAIGDASGALVAFERWLTALQPPERLPRPCRPVAWPRHWTPPTLRMQQG